MEFPLAWLYETLSSWNAIAALVLATVFTVVFCIYLLSPGGTATELSPTGRKRKAASGKGSRIEADSGTGGHDHPDEGSIVKHPGYISLYQKIDSKGSPTDYYKIEVHEQKPQETEINCGSYSLRLVNGTCRHVVCIDETRKVLYKALSDYSDKTSGEGWFKVPKKKFSGFMSSFSHQVNLYKSH